MSALRRSVTFLGVVLLWAAMGFVAYAVAWQSHKNHAQAVMLRGEHGVIANTAVAKPGHPVRG